MLERGITALTVVNVLERGLVKDAEEYTHGQITQWRYRVETNRYRVVVTFEVENEAVVINAIDFAPHLGASKAKGD
jgi:mRNA-degrading endonuclease RelE of RelBE toxin-antitoxin system